jgi:LPS O-antigen subunit length determinant protein (WzzB/FepE family)
VATGETGAKDFVTNLQGRLKAIREGGAVVGPAVDVPADIQQRVQQFFERAEQDVARLNKERDEALTHRKGAPPLAVIPPDATPALQAQANALQAEEAIIQASLKRQEALTKASFDVQRQQLDEEIAHRLEVEPQAVEQLGQERKAREAALGHEEAAAQEAIQLDSAQRILGHAPTARCRDRGACGKIAGAGEDRSAEGRSQKQI